MNALPPDPYEGQESPADIAFGAWLEQLDVIAVLTSVERRLRGDEAARLRYLKRRLQTNRFRNEERDAKQ
jgi:hypothetical protein